MKDLADGVIRAAQRGAAGTAYNLGNHDNVITVEALADCVLEITGSPSPKEFVDPTDIYGTTFMEANDKFPAAGRAVTELGWRPTRGIEDVVLDTWSYMRASSAETFARLAGQKIIEQLVEAQTHGVHSS